ncbi:hypothetical protein PJ900_03050 (plasmid) [Tistrella mobilis]|uniref:hypothetical protein n=2 Tax=Tistrella mobilis TaxID=171437 RepID=UPI0018D276CD|nr:hypothetical protein [Tistrella mobilis]
MTEARMTEDRTADERLAGGRPRPSTHDAWFRARVQEALDDTAGDLSDDQVNARLAARREAALRRAGGV